MLPGEESASAVDDYDVGSVPEEPSGGDFPPVALDAPFAPVVLLESSKAHDPLNEGPPALPHACLKGEMLYKGRCESKARVSEIVREREQEALENARNATDPVASVDATHEFLEQQVTQAAQAEDDLDEILETLRREKARKASPPAMEAQ